MGNASVPLIFFTGFLGSGKTTVLNDALAQLRDRRVAVVVNEWGKLPVDGALLKDPSGLGIVEVAGGQIFCSCLSGSFLKALERLVALGAEMILVETSGLAKPATLGELAAEAEKRSGGLLRYRGLVCVVDALRFVRLRSVALAVNEQVRFADRFIITKADLASESALQETIEILKSLRPGAPFALRRGEEVALDTIIPPQGEEASTVEILKNLEPFDPQWSGWGLGGSPATDSILPARGVEKSRLELFLQRLSPETFRIKGFVYTPADTEPLLVDCVEETIKVKPWTGGESRALQGGLAIIWKKRAPSREKLLELWTSITGTEGRLLEAAGH